MTLNDVAAESRIGPHRPFEIDERARRQIAETGSIQRFTREIPRKNEFARSERAVRQTPFTAMLDPSRRSPITVRASDAQSCGNRRRR